jgi:hypothetical protein
MKNFLTIPEELFLLAVNETEGSIQSTYQKPFRTALAGAILMNLALEHRIDTDVEKLIIDKKEATEDDVLNIAFNEIKLNTSNDQIEYWINKLTTHSEQYGNMILNSLIRKGVLKIDDKKVLWVFSSRKYPVVNNTEIVEVKARIRDLIFSDEIPDVQDIVIVSMLFNSGMLDLLLADSEIDQNIDRIQQIAKMDLIGQSIGRAIENSTLNHVIAEFGKLVSGNPKTPEEKLEEKVQQDMKKYRFKRVEDLPAWLRKGTDQYERTLDFVRKTGTADIIYSAKGDKYMIKRYSARGPAFSGEV